MTICIGHYNLSQISNHCTPFVVSNIVEVNMSVHLHKHIHVRRTHVHERHDWDANHLTDMNETL